MYQGGPAGDRPGAGVLSCERGYSLPETACAVLSRKVLSAAINFTTLILFTVLLYHRIRADFLIFSETFLNDGAHGGRSFRRASSRTYPDEPSWPAPGTRTPGVGGVPVHSRKMQRRGFNAPMGRECRSEVDESRDAWVVRQFVQVQF
jgi:hypothetical protein